MNSLIVVFGLVIVVRMVLVIYRTVAENRWGINFSAVSCPCCKAPLPQIRKFAAENPMPEPQPDFGSFEFHRLEHSTIIVAQL